MKRTILLYLLSVFFIETKAQDLSVFGAIINNENKSISSVSSVLLSAKDSFIVAQSRTDINGVFKLNVRDTGSYILFVSHPGFADYIEKITITSSNYDFGKITLLSKEDILKEVIVTANAAAIRIKGDTTEFIADSFKVRDGANVEELLKKLPGFEVDRNGRITAYGETVKKVLVDGEEFFGYDPTLVTRNFEAKMIDKVQLYDKKSDQAAFTGIDDGNKTKTVNLKLKEKSKYGYFGKLDGGLGTSGFYSSQAMFNSFRGKRKFSVFGTAANTGLIGLTQSDQRSYGISRATVNDNGVVFVTANNSDGLNSWSGRYDGRGIPHAVSGGIHYHNKWNEDKVSVNGNWMFNRLNVEGKENIISQNNLPNSILITKSENEFANKIFTHGYDVEAETQTGEKSSIKITSEGSYSNKKTENNYNTETFNENRQLNYNNRTLNTQTQNQYYGNSILWRRKMNKERRTISINISQQSSAQNSQGDFFSKAHFYSSTATIDSTQSIDQKKDNELSSKTITTKIAYSEPLSNTLSLISNYSFGYNNSVSDIRTFNKQGSEYSLLDSLLSNKYILEQVINQGGAAFNFQKGKVRSQIGADIGLNNMEQKNHYTDQLLKRQFINWYPNFSFNYAFSRQRNLTFTYSGNTQMPSVSQLQPIVVNDDPLNIFIGNEQLKPAFDNDFNLMYVHYDRAVKTPKVYFANAGYGFVVNPIVIDMKTNEQGQTTYKHINNLSKYNINYFTNLQYQSAFPDKGLSFYITFNFNGDQYSSIINDSQNTSKEHSFSINPNGGYRLKNEKLNFYLSNSFSYNTMASSINVETNNYWSVMIRPSVTINFSKTFYLQTDAAWNWQEETQLFPDNFNRVIWNATLNKSFLKNNDLTIKLYANDILNQNIGISQSVRRNYFIQNNYTTIRRYFMLSVVWKFNKMHGNEE